MNITAEKAVASVLNEMRALPRWAKAQGEYQKALNALDEQRKKLVSAKGPAEARRVVDEMSRILLDVRRALWEIEQGGKELTRSLPSGSGFDQGIRGRLIDASGKPVANALITLARSSNPRRSPYPPVAQALTGADGKFAVGLQTWVENRVYELRFTHAKFQDRTLAKIMIQPEDWFHAGDQKLKEPDDR